MSFINWTVSGYDHEFCHCGTTKGSATKFAPAFLNRWSLVRRGRSPDRHRTLSRDNQQQERIIESLHMKYSGWASSLENSPKASASPRYFPWFLLGNLNDSFSSISFPNTVVSSTPILRISSIGRGHSLGWQQIDDEWCLQLHDK